MEAIGGSPETVGQKVAAALVGTFIGILLCYGVVGPIAARLEHQGEMESQFLQVLRIYLAVFAGQRAAMAELVGMGEGPMDRAFTELKEALGLSGAAAGSRVEAPAGSPPFTGLVERSDSHAVVVRMESPIPGAAVLGAHDCGGPVMVWLNLYAYGSDAERDVERAAAPLRAWMAERYPMPAADH